LEGCCNILVNFTAHAKDSGHVFDNIKHSFRGAERQRKSPLQLAYMFNGLMLTKVCELRADGATGPEDVMHRHALDECFEDYNAHAGVQQQSKWQMLEDDQNTIANLIFGVSARVKVMIRGHLDEHKGASGGTTGLFFSNAK
jgi:hypothetical protein